MMREVTVTGVLRRYEPPHITTALPRTVQQSPPHFYFELRDTTLSLSR